MPIEDKKFTDINGAEHLLSEEIDNLKDWLVQQEYEGLNTVTDFSEGAMNYLLLCFAGDSKFDIREYGDGLIRHAFLNTARGEFLERKAAENGIFKIPAEYATTMLRLQIPEPLPVDAQINAGTEVGTDEAIIYDITEDTTIPAGSTTVYTEIRCQEPGEIGNVKAGTIINVFTDLNFELTVFNESDVDNGKEAESDESLRERAGTPGVGTDLWLENVAKTLVDDALCHNLEDNIKLLVFKPTVDVVKADIEELFQQKMYRTRNVVIIQEAAPYPVIDESKNIHLILKNGFVPETVINILRTRIAQYVDKIKLGDLFRTICIKYLCESTEGVLYADLTGYSDIDLTNEQYAVISGDLQITTEGE